jgi:hypothetical protein
MRVITDDEPPPVTEPVPSVSAGTGHASQQGKAAEVTTYRCRCGLMIDQRAE